VARQIEALAASGFSAGVICLHKDGERRIQRDGRVTLWRLPLRQTRGLRPARYLTEHGVVAMERSPFHNVTFASTRFDAIAKRKPMLVSRTRSVEQTFGSPCMELFESGDPDDLARAIRVIHAQPERRRLLTERAAAAAARFQLDRQREVHLGVVEHLLRPAEVTDPATGPTSVV
jgi:hypothetical protein